MARKPIYVEIEIDSTLDEVWHKSQNPSLHEQWDLRFSSISYEEKIHEDDVQKFTYTTKLIPGVAVSGWGESKGTHERKTGEKTSSLHFGTEQIISPIKEGKGYWQYIPQNEKVIFLTQYDYSVRYGIIGKAFDKLFKPLMGWATALSFDVLKRWLETGERPQTQYARFFSYHLLILLFTFTWLYQGLVPKLLLQHPLEIKMLQGLSTLSNTQAKQFINMIGLAEIVIGILWLIRSLQQKMLVIQLILLPFLTVSAIISEPTVAIAPFNVVTFNTALWLASFTAILIKKHCPTATSCKRKRGERM